MRILIVEDDLDKRKKIVELVESKMADVDEIVERESLRSGLRTIIEDRLFDAILLDMSMPGFDISEDEPSGGAPESFAGEEIMAQMKLRGIKIPVVVITQYKSFEKGTVGLQELVSKFTDEFSDFFRGAIYYNSAIESWKKELVDHLKSATAK
ncbi:response regulator [Paraburkholderia sp. RP-4-7]|uniref:Response regulator n=1 Tax=Paraburkholderia polaris TaxID=2728848 RepID=A0A848IR91_9BURK|nr:response regulator [Paraburkholderia polaris]NMM03546.1 response regulator [Paraburkholderia polaris]